LVEVATSDPDSAERFYGSLFDWTFDADGPAASAGMDYRNIKASSADGLMGGIFGTGGQVPDHAVFYILVADVQATCADAEQLGGSVEQAPRPRPRRTDVRLSARPVGQPVRRVQPAGGLMARHARNRPRRSHSAGTTPVTCTRSSPTTCSTTRQSAEPR
jgi:predicted enzyme related to lactoylglutathione lyase